MRFVPRQPREGINVSDTHPLIEAGTLVAGLAAIFVAIALVVVFLVEAALYFVTAEDEAKLFSGWLPEDLVIVSADDRRLSETQVLVDRLARHWPDAPYKFRVQVDDSEVANAMALPGGLIVVTRGLLDQVESENELAFVIGHELGHFRNRDHLRALGRGVALSLVLVVVTGSDVAGVGIKAADITLRGFSRRQEAGADEFGLALVYQEYGHVDQAWRLFERWEADGNPIHELVGYLSTHPQTRERITRMKAYAERQQWRLQGEIVPLGW